MMYRFTNNSSRVRLFIDGVLFLKGITVITTGIRLVNACKAAGLTQDTP